MKANTIRKAVLFGIAASTLALGCELIVDFDRTKIPVEGSDAATVTPEASTDATTDTSQPDAADAATGTDAATADADAGADASDDAPDGD